MYKTIIGLVFEAESEEMLPTIADVKERFLDMKPGEKLTWCGIEVKVTQSATWQERAKTHALCATCGNHFATCTCIKSYRER